MFIHFRKRTVGSAGQKPSFLYAFHLPLEVPEELQLGVTRGLAPQLAKAGGAVKGGAFWCGEHSVETVECY